MNTRTLLALAPVNRVVLLEALVLVLAVRVALRVLPFAIVRRGLDRWAHVKIGTTAHDVRHVRDVRSAGFQPGRVAWAVSAIGRRARGTTCLTEALAADTMLRRYGHAPSLKIGVRRGAVISLDAHAWVEVGGAVVIGTTPLLAEYAVLSSLHDR